MTQQATELSTLSREDLLAKIDTLNKERAHGNITEREFWDQVLVYKTELFCNRKPPTNKRKNTPAPDFDR